MTIPTIHPNGTSKKQLLSAYEDAYEALNHAYKVLKRSAPNARDYDPQGLDAAIDEHAKRLAAIEGVMDELDELCHQICGEE